MIAVLQWFSYINKEGHKVQG